MAESHELLGGMLRVYKRENSSQWQCSTFLNGKNHRKSTKEESLSRAMEVAEDWLLDMRGKSRVGMLKRPEFTFNHAADRFEKEFEVITEGQRSPDYLKQLKQNLQVHLRPFFGKKGISEITAVLVQDYRIERVQNPRKGKRPGRSQIHHEIITLRHVMKAVIQPIRWAAGVFTMR